jgi:hypothetical protein
MPGHDGAGRAEPPTLNMSLDSVAFGHFAKM